MDGYNASVFVRENTNLVSLLGLVLRHWPQQDRRPYFAR